MTADNIPAVIEDIYTSLANDNEEIDLHIARLKKELAVTGAKEAAFDPARLPIGNRTGRKTMQAYFKKRGVTVVFK